MHITTSPPQPPVRGAGSYTCRRTIVCIRRSPFTYSRSRAFSIVRRRSLGRVRSCGSDQEPSVLTEWEDIKWSEESDSPYETPLPVDGDELDSSSDARQLDLARNSPDSWLRDTLSLIKLELHQLSGSPSRLPDDGKHLRSKTSSKSEAESESNPFVVLEDEIKETNALLPSLLSPKARKTRSSPITCIERAVIKKRQLEENQDDETIVLTIKKPRQPRTPLGKHQLNKPVTALITSTSIFDSSKWSSIDENVFCYVSDDHRQISASSQEEGSSVTFAKAQVSIDYKPLIFIPPPEVTFTGPSRFLPALDIFDVVITDCDAMRRHQDNPSWCLANKADGLRCRWGMDRYLDDEIDQRLQELSGMNIYEDLQVCRVKFIELVIIAVCHYHRYAVIADLNTAVRDHEAKRHNLIKAEMRDPTPLTSVKIEEPIVLVQKESKKTKSFFAVTSSFTTVFEKDYSFGVPVSRTVQSAPKCHPYLNPESETVEQVAQKPLTESNWTSSSFRQLDETRTGWIYVYWNRASFGLVKIGCTTVSVEDRLQDWEAKCGYPAVEYYRSPVRVKHVARVEKLIHAEFRANRVCMFCRHCWKSHIEWFQGLELSFVIRRINAWTSWAMKEPYTWTGAAWKRGVGSEYELPQIEAAPKITDSPKKDRTSTTRGAPRYNLRSRRAMVAS